MTQREILFKAKRKDNGEWVEGYPVPVCVNTYKEGYELIEKDGINYDELDGFNPSYISHKIDPITLSQFTGLIDMNGNKIWENDIVLYDDEYWCISWSNQDACFVFEQDDFVESFSNIWGKDCEVYGNIFDNKELLPIYETDHCKTYEKEYMRMHIETEEDLNKLDGSLDLYEASNHYPPYIVCSEETKQMLNKYKDRFPLIKDKKEYQGLDIYYFVKIKVDNTLPFGEIEIV